MDAYVPFYLLYFILMALHIQFAQTAIGITRRYRRLNLAIRNIFAASKWPILAVFFIFYHTLDWNDHNIWIVFLSLFFAEKLNETVSNLSTKNKVIVQPMKPTTETQLPGASSQAHVSTSGTKPMDKLSTISHEANDENHVMPLPDEPRVSTASIASIASASYGLTTNIWFVLFDSLAQITRFFVCFFFARFSSHSIWLVTVEFLLSIHSVDRENFFLHFFLKIFLLTF